MVDAASRAPTYHEQIDDARVRENYAAQAKSVAKKIFDNKVLYQAITAKSNVPYWWIGPTHNRESSLNFGCHLHEGSPLTGRTKYVPKGRPASGNPPFTFEESALDALMMAPHKLQEVKRWSAERGCYEWERYNGWGYLKRGPSPYVFAGTTVYEHGKYVADGVYSDSVVDKQLGTLVVLKELAKLDPEVAAALMDREPGPPPDVLHKETKDAKTGRKVGAGTAVGGAAGEGANAGTTVPDKPAFISPVITFTAIGVGIALVILCSIIISRKVAMVNSQMGDPAMNFLNNLALDLQIGFFLAAIAAAYWYWIRPDAARAPGTESVL
jgi:lysozyme family protein